jgi:hypothetical protein
MRTSTWEVPWQRHPPRPRILLIDDFFPDVTIGAGAPRMVELLRALRAARADVTLLPTDRWLNLDAGREQAHAGPAVIGCDIDFERYLLEQRGCL